MDPLTLLYRDDDLVAIDKTAWSIVHRTRGADGATVLVDVLGEQLGQRVFPVHRLDRQTSGVMVFALGASAASSLSADIREGLWRKQYLGLCRGVVREHVTVDHPVPEDDKRRPARTQIEPLEVFCQRYTLVRCEPLTGRRHQVRYHLKHLSHPLVCDANYGKGPINRFFRETFALGRLFLHAERLRLPRPGRAETLDLSAPLPGELLDVLERLRAHDGPVA